jgi:hypothetical protein
LLADKLLRLYRAVKPYAEQLDIAAEEVSDE